MKLIPLPIPEVVVMTDKNLSLPQSPALRSQGWEVRSRGDFKGPE